jgi:hypothetical protein
MPLKLIAMGIIPAEGDSDGREPRLKLIPVETNRDGNKAEKSDSRLILIFLRGNPDGNETQGTILAI